MAEPGSEPSSRNGLHARQGYSALQKHEGGDIVGTVCLLRDSSMVPGSSALSLEPLMSRQKDICPLPGQGK